MKKLLVILLILMLIPSLVLAQNIPRAYGFVNDFANVLIRDGEINSMLEEVEKQTTAEVVVVTVNSSDITDTDTYAVELFDEWNIGKSDKDNGLLILLDVYNRRIKVEVGYGLEGILNDAKVGRILDDYAVEYLKNNSYDEGVYQAALQFSNVIMENKEEVLSGETMPSGNDFDFYDFFWIYFIFAFFLIPIISSIKARVRTPKCSCGGKTKFIRREYRYGYYYNYYRCEKCGKEIVKRKKKRNMPLIFFLGGRGGGGFGGFGGGGSGGGGAGRGF